MKWQQRVRVATGLSCWQIMLHLLVVALLVVGWMSKTLVHVGVGLCALYCVTVVMMLVSAVAFSSRSPPLKSTVPPTKASTLAVTT